MLNKQDRQDIDTDLDLTCQDESQPNPAKGIAGPRVGVLRCSPTQHEINTPISLAPDSYAVSILQRLLLSLLRGTGTSLSLSRSLPKRTRPAARLGRLQNKAQRKRTGQSRAHARLLHLFSKFWTSASTLFVDLPDLAGGNIPQSSKLWEEEY